jgi:hypothetical protein
MPVAPGTKGMGHTPLVYQDNRPFHPHLFFSFCVGKPKRFGGKWLLDEDIRRFPFIATWEAREVKEAAGYFVSGHWSVVIG